MRIAFLILLAASCFFTAAQTTPGAGSSFSNSSYKDSLIKEKLLGLAMDNPAIAGANAQIEAANIEYKKSKTSWLEAIRVTANINEFVVNNSPNASFFPKYNLGLNLPLNIFGATSSNKKIAAEKIKMVESEKQLKERALRREVLTKYENYKEARELFELQKSITEGQLNNYKKVQKDYADEVITDINEVNDEYRKYLDEKLKQRANEKQLNIAILELEELIGMRLDLVLAAVDKSAH